MSLSTAQSRKLSEAKEADETRLDRVFHALSDRTRRAIVARVIKSPAKITELAKPFAMSLPAVSKHVRVLEEAGLIQRTVDGRVHRCTFTSASLEDADQWINRHRLMWKGALDRLAEYVAKDEL